MTGTIVTNSAVSSNPDYEVKRLVTSEGEIQHVMLESGFQITGYDYIAVTYPVATQEVYVFKSGGSGGTTVATVTLDYTDSTKANLSTATKT